MTGARFLRRYVAWSIDALLIAMPALLLCRDRIEAGLVRITANYEHIATSMAQAVLDLIDRGGGPAELAGVLIGDIGMQSAVSGLVSAVLATVWPPMAAFAVIGFVYYMVFEASSWQATPGKRLLGLRVSTVDGGRLGVVAAAVRQLAGVLSWLTLNLGHAWALKPPQRRALHDHIAGARVTQSDAAAALPWWARLWLLAQAAALLFALVWLYRAANAATSRAFDSLL